MKIKKMTCKKEKTVKHEQSEEPSVNILSAAAYK